MSAIYEEFERELGRLRLRYAAAPREELTRLFLLALEREEIVSIAYRESAIVERLARMPIDDDVRELIRHALVWAWKDEEMHTIYIRGAILRRGSFVARMTAYMRQMAGAVGGWASSIRQNARWRDAPFSRFAATAITTAGTLTGQVPSGVREALNYGPFRNFCEYNIDAEKTAARCWSRITELTEGDSSFPISLLEDFRRITADEVRHQEIFEVLFAALDEDDHLSPNESAASLAARIGAIGENFLPRQLRAPHPLGAGGIVRIATSIPDKRAALRQILFEAKLAERLAGRKSVAIKPTFMLGYDRRDLSHITDPDLVDELARALRDAGITDVAVIESETIYDRFYANRSVASVARYLGFDSNAYRIVDASSEQVVHSYSRGLAQTTIARTWRDADFRISFAKMRSHPIELAYLSVANCEWIGGRCDHYLFSERQAQRQTTIMMLLADFPPDFALIDACDSAADGIIGAMGCPRPRTPHRLYAGDDALAVDLVAARHMGVTETRADSVLRAAAHWFGTPSIDLRIAGTDEPIADWRGPYDNELWAMLSAMSYPVYVLGSGRGTLFTPEMDTAVFPPLTAESAMLRIGRGAMRRLIGLHHSR
ncbi:MAG TPA: DUF362 domain-containing protein [Thermoanaerobaculia bacterium]|nr:DUF362 domain-containing protein [Thermoanaerobaculia bacterium]